MDATSSEEISKRIRLVREALKMSQAALCRLADISAQAWNNAETGDNMLTVQNAVKLCRISGVTLDWIYRGVARSEVSLIILEEIQRQAGAKMAFPRRRRSKKKKAS